MLTRVTCKEQPAVLREVTPFSSVTVSFHAVGLAPVTYKDHPVVLQIYSFCLFPPVLILLCKVGHSQVLCIQLSYREDTLGCPKYV
jgi:hypothetical protein